MTAFTVNPATNVFSAVAHGLVDLQPVVVNLTSSAPGDALPSPLVADVVYNVRDVAPDTFKLAYYAGGSAIDILTSVVGTAEVRDARPISALDKLFEDCRTAFGAAGRLEVLDWGRRALTKQTNQQAASAGRAGRVVFVPGDDTGKAGKLGPVRHPGQRPRSIARWDELAQVHVWGRDSISPNDERANYRVVWNLFELVMRAIRESACGRVEHSDPLWTIEPVERVFGAELTFSVTVHGRVSDDSITVVKPTTPQQTSQISFPGGDITVQ